MGTGILDGLKNIGKTAAGFGSAMSGIGTAVSGISAGVSIFQGLTGGDSSEKTTASTNTSNTPSRNNSVFDINGDGKINTADLKESAKITKALQTLLA